MEGAADVTSGSGSLSGGRRAAGSRPSEELMEAGGSCDGPFPGWP